MGLGLRIFFVDDEDSIHRIPVSRWDKLQDSDSDEHFPEHAGKCVRSAMVVLELVNRKPVAVNRTFFSQLYFNSNGQLDVDKILDAARLASDITELDFLEAPKKTNVIDAKKQFSTKIYKNLFKWTPTPQINDAITKAIFGNE